MNSVLDKKKGCLYGLAIGDALGAAVEFKRKGSFEPVTGYRGGGPHPIAAGDWTDDTSMALALADSIATVGWDPKDQLERYLDWVLNGKYSVIGRCFDCGATTYQAINSFRHHGTLVGPAEVKASGNGSIMRLAPVVLKYRNTPELKQRARESSQTTHASPLCLAS